MLANSTMKQYQIVLHDTDGASDCHQFAHKCITDMPRNQLKAPLTLAFYTLLVVSAIVALVTTSQLQRPALAASLFQAPLSILQPTGYHAPVAANNSAVLQRPADSSSTAQQQQQKQRQQHSEKSEKKGHDILITLMSQHWWTGALGQDWVEPQCDRYQDQPLACRFLSIVDNSKLTNASADQLVAAADAHLYHICPGPTHPAARPGTPVVAMSAESSANYPCLDNLTVMQQATIEMSYRSCAQVGTTVPSGRQMTCLCRFLS